MDQDKVLLNEDAWGYLDDAMFTSSLISDKERQKGEVDDVEDIYPRTKEEALYMDEQLQHAMETAKEPNEENFAERYGMLREIVDWSLKRHSTWKWSLIAGALLGAGIFYYFKKDQEEDIRRAKIEREQVKEWHPIDVVQTPFDKCPDEHANNAYSLRLSAADKYKMYKLIDLKSSVEYNQKSSKEYGLRADTAKLAENKEKYLNSQKSYAEKAVQKRAEYDSINAMDFKQIHEMAQQDLARRVESEESHGNTLYAYMVYLLILIPLYIITGYPHGYSITRHRRRSGCMNIFRKVGFGIASFCFGAGLAMSLLPDDIVKTTYSDGHTETRNDSNPANLVILALKFGLMIVGAFIFCFVASVIMTIETFYGLLENFNWKGLMAKMRPPKQVPENK